MDLLLYSSDEEVLPETSHINPESFEGSLSPSHLPEPSNLTLYSQNFAAHNGMLSALSYIVWKPSIGLKLHLKDVSFRALKKLELQNVSEFSPDIWHYVGEPSTTMLGRYSLTNMNNLHDFHITLQNNVFGEPETIRHVTRALSNSIQNMKVPPSLIGVDQRQMEVQSKISEVFQFNEPKIPPKMLKLKFDNKAVMFRSSKTSNAFLTFPIDMSGDQGQFFREIETNFNEIRRTFNLPENPIEFPHVTVMVGEPKGQMIASSYKSNNLGKIVKELEIEMNDLANLELYVDGVTFRNSDNELLVGKFNTEQQDFVDIMDGEETKDPSIDTDTQSGPILEERPIFSEKKPVLKANSKSKGTFRGGRWVQ